MKIIFIIFYFILKANSYYTYTVKATNAGGDSAATAPANATTQACSGGTPAGLPAAPTGLTAKSLSDTEILLAWTDNSNNETGFIIERFDGIKWETAGTVGANVIPIRFQKMGFAMRKTASLYFRTPENTGF